MSRLGCLTALMLILSWSGCGSGAVSGDAVDPEVLGSGGSETALPDDPPQPEACGNGFDDDRDGLVDEDCPCDPKNGAEQECYSGAVRTKGVGACQAGTQSCGGDIEFPTWGSCEGEVVPVAEICGDEIDNDCNGTVDDPVVCDPPTSSSDSSNVGGGSIGGSTDTSSGSSGDSFNDWVDTVPSSPTDWGWNDWLDTVVDRGYDDDPNAWVDVIPEPNTGDPWTDNVGCNSATCPHGCCDAAGQCQSPNTQHCGVGGGSCKACSGGETCDGTTGWCDSASSDPTSPAPTSQGIPYEVTIVAIGDIDDCDPWYTFAALFGHGKCDTYTVVSLEGAGITARSRRINEDNSPIYNSPLFRTTDTLLKSHRLLIQVTDREFALTSFNGADTMGRCAYTITQQDLNNGGFVLPYCGGNVKRVRFALRRLQ